METEFATFATFATPKPETPYARVRPISNDVASVASVAKQAGRVARVPSAGAPGSWPLRAAALLECLEWPPADYQSESIGNAPMKQCVTAKFANDSHSGRAVRSAVSYLPGAA